MNTSNYLPLLICLSLPVLSYGAPEFTGILSSSKKVTFALSDERSGASKWISLHQSFEGYEAFEYDARDEILSLKKDDTILRLKLKDSKVQEGQYPVTGTITTAAGEVSTVRDVALILGREATFPLAENVVLRLTTTRRSDGNLEYKADIERTIEDGSKQTMASPTIIGRPSQRVALEAAGYKFEFQPN